jgi:hypothetical protein
LSDAEVVDVVTANAMQDRGKNLMTQTDATHTDVELVDVVTANAMQDIGNNGLANTETTLTGVEVVDSLTEIADRDKGKKVMANPEDELLYDPVKSVTKKKEIWRLGIILDDMWTIYKGDTEDHIELLVRDAKVLNRNPTCHTLF